MSKNYKILFVKDCIVIVTLNAKLSVRTVFMFLLMLVVFSVAAFASALHVQLQASS
jgi:hypothetical protein